MKTLIVKESRLLLPAFAGALALAILPAWLLPYDRWNPHDYSAMFFCFGIALLSLSSFGREIGFNTLSLMLAQPVHRVRLWRTKAVVLAVFVALAFEAWWLSVELVTVVRPAVPISFAVVGAFVAAFFAAGLWMTLLLRQVVAAFWLTLLIPLVASMAIKALGGSDEIVITVLALYAIAGFFLARRKFLSLQDTAWTGGVVTFGGRRVAEGSASRQHRPWAALFRKELQLHEFTLAGIAVLAVLHLAAVVLRTVGANMFGRSTLEALEMFGVVWMFVPLLAGSHSIADERQLRTLDGILCLPVSRKAQFALKLFFVLVLGGLLSPLLLCGIEAIGNHLHAGAHLGVMGFTFSGRSDVHLIWIFLVLALIGFYASTLTQSVVQGLAAGIVATLLYWGIHNFDASQYMTNLSGYKLWPVIAYPILILTLLRLAYGNFRYLFETGRRWRLNIFTLIAVNIFIYTGTAAIYNRVWEFAMPLESAHGPARLPDANPIALRGNGGSALGVILPDGRLWTDRTLYDRITPANVSFFAPGSNWLDVVPLDRETVALRSNGTLWLSDSNASPFAQFGSETNWKSLAHYGTSSVVLLKTDGSLWFWGTNTVNWRTFRGLRAWTPRRLGSDSDWDRIVRGAGTIFAWKRNGEAWASHSRDRDEDWDNIRLPMLDHMHFKAMDSFRTVQYLEIGIRDDGTLWYWNRWNYVLRTGKGARPNVWDLITSKQLVQIGKDSDWTAVASLFTQVIALKSDGSLWKWNLMRKKYWNIDGLLDPPQRLGINHDWLALGVWKDESVALAADGTIWSWPAWSDTPREWLVNPDLWLFPSRRSTKLVNIFDSTGSTLR